MFIGHYGPAAAVAGKQIKLWHGFVAVQVLDILWAPFVLADIEQIRIVENFTQSNHFDLYHMPYTHSLPAALIWSILGGLAFIAMKPSAGRRGGIIIGLLSFSHWLLDFIMHKPDLLLWYGGPKVGLGLWDNRPVTMIMEIGFLLAGMLIYLRATTANGKWGRIAPTMLVLTLVGAQITANFGPPPPSVNDAAQTALIAFGVAALIAFWCDQTRQSRQ